jgi:hypothetical protein
MDRSIFEKIEEKPCRRGAWIRYRARTPTLQARGWGLLLRRCSVEILYPLMTAKRTIRDGNHEAAHERSVA